MSRAESQPSAAQPRATAQSVQSVQSLTEEEKGVGCGVCALKCNKEDMLGLQRYNYRYLCTPSMPWSKGGVAPPLFIGKDVKLPLLLALVMGFQHCIAMLAGIATSGGLLIAGDACFPWQYDSELCDAQAYLVSAAWITSGLLTCVQVFRAKIRGTKFYLGTGLVSVMGTSFTFLPIAREMVVNAINDAKNAGECNGNDCRGAGMKGYGEFLGTCMVAGLLEIAISFLPTRVLKRLFPPVVTGASVMLIGGGLIATGVKYIGGGVFCADNQASTEAALGNGPTLCNENGEVVLAFGAPEYVGLGFSVIVMAVFIQFFGSPFLKSTFLFWSLLFGCFVSGVSNRKGREGEKTLCSVEPQNACIGGLADVVVGKEYIYWTDSRIADADPITFLWTTTFPLGFAPEYLLPLLIAYFVSAAETVGDIACSCVASRVPAVGHDFDARVQGGLLADGVNSILACLFTSPPNTTFSQNNGVISLTRCASRAAGFACAFWLILFGVLGKIGGVFVSIPICVVGGMVLMCFSMVFVGGMKLAASNLTRRNSFILMLALGFGLGVAMEPQLFVGGGVSSFYGQNLAFLYGFWPKEKTCSVFPTAPVIVETCTLNGYEWAPDGAPVCDPNADPPGYFENICDSIGGDYFCNITGFEEVTDCLNNNGACCVEYDSGKRSGRTTAIIILYTPYCIGFLIAMLLNLTLPFDKEDDDMEYDIGEDSLEKEWREKDHHEHGHSAEEPAPEQPKEDGGEGVVSATA